MAASEKEGRFYGWWLLPILCFVYSIPIGFVLYGPPVIYQFMQNELHWQRGEINLGYSIIGIMLGLGAPLAAWMLNRIGPRLTLTVGAILAGLSALLLALLGQFYPLYLVLCFFAGLGISMGSVVPVQALVIYWFNARRALAMGLVLGGGALGGFIYPQIISACILTFGGDWRVGWNLIAIMSIVGAVLALIAVRNRPEDLGQHQDGLSPQKKQEAIQRGKHKPIRTYRTHTYWTASSAAKTHSMWFILAATACVFFLWQIILTQTPFHLRDKGFVSSDPLLFLRPEFIYGLILLCSIIGRLSVSFLGEIIETRYLMTIAGLSMLVAAILFMVASKDIIWAVFLYPLLAGFGFGVTYVSCPLITGNYFGARAFPPISGIINAANSVVQFSAPFIAGSLYDLYSSYAIPILIGSIGALIGTVLIFFCTPPRPGPVAAD